MTYRPLTPDELNHPDLSRLDFYDMPETPRQTHERYIAAVDITGTPRRATHIPAPSDPWVPLKVSIALTAILFAIVTGSVIFGAFS